MDYFKSTIIKSYNAIISETNFIKHITMLSFQRTKNLNYVFLVKFRVIIILIKSENGNKNCGIPLRLF